MPAGMMYVRLVHLLDEQKRKELMIIYGEYLAPTGFSVADLSQGGKAFDRCQRSKRICWIAPRKKSPYSRIPIRLKPVPYPFCCGFALEQLRTEG